MLRNCSLHLNIYFIKVMGCWQVPSMRVVSSCGCEGGVGGKEGLVEAFVKWWGGEKRRF